ncbi:hypothetical protein D6D05_04324 [Aureobasidium pullulans]|nr:hypothetical protein D6D05_04324 [Aureobasidium pullulans]
MVHFATSYACLTAGLGKPYDMIRNNISQLSSTAVASAVTFVLALYIAKIAALVFLMRIQSKTRNPRLYVVLIALYSILGIASAIIVSAGCPSSSGYYWNIAANIDSCPGEEARWQVMTALDVISEAILLVLPVHLVWSLQMPQKRKLMIVITFWTRLPTIPLSIIRQTYTSHLASSSSPHPIDISLASTLVTILMAIELTYALISCTLTTSKNFTDGFSTGFGMGHMPGAAESYNLSAVGGGSSSGGGGTGTGIKEGYRSQIATGATGTGMGTGHRFHVKTPSFDDEEVEEGPLRLRQGGEGRTTVAVVSGGGNRYWGEGESVSDGGHDDLGIVRHTEYIVSHDEAPILGKHSMERL